MLVGRRKALGRVPDRPDRPSPDGGPVGLILALLDWWKLPVDVWSTWIAFVDSISASTHRTGVGISDCRTITHGTARRLALRLLAVAELVG